MVNNNISPKNPIKSRKSFPIKDKWQAINAINDLILYRHSLCTVSEEWNTLHWYYEKLRKMTVKADKIAPSHALSYL